MSPSLFCYLLFVLLIWPFLPVITHRPSNSFRLSWLQRVRLLSLSSTFIPEYTIHRIDVCHATHLWTVPNSNSVYYTGRMKKFSLQDRSRKIASMEKIVPKCVWVVGCSLGIRHGVIVLPLFTLSISQVEPYYAT